MAKISGLLDATKKTFTNLVLAPSRELGQTDGIDKINENFFTNAYKGEASLSTKDGRPRISEGELRALLIEEKISAVEVAKKLRFPSDASRYDRIDFELTPYLILPTMWIGKTGIHWLKMIAPTQSGKTVFLQIFVADTIMQSPGNMLYMMPTGDTASRGFQDKILNMIQTTPELFEHVTYPLSSCLTTWHAYLDNMTIHAVCSNSAAQLSSITCPRVVADEVRAMGLSIGNESNPLKLLADRMTVYLEDGLGQGAMVSTPSVEGDLLHLQLSIPETVILYWYTKCEHCGKYQILDFFTNMFSAGQPIDHCLCQFCCSKMNDKDKKIELNRHGRYGIDGLDGVEVMPEPPKEKNIVFWYTSMNSPFRSFKSIYNEYIATKDDMNQYRNFIQCWLAQFWENDISATTIEDVKRRLDHDQLRGVVPDGTKCITCGVDTQDDGFYYVIEAHFDMVRSRIIEMGFLESNMYIDSVDVMRSKFASHFENKLYYDKTGKAWSISLWGIDTGGHRTQPVYQACQGFLKVVMCKGKKIDNNIQVSSTNKDLYIVNTYNYLEITDKRLSNDVFSIYGAATISDLHQLIAVRKIKKELKTTGEEAIVWKKIGKCDLRYALVHSQIVLDVNINRMRLRDELNEPDFTYNPLSEQLRVSLIKREEKEKEKGRVRKSSIGQEIDLENNYSRYSNDFSTGGTML